MVKKYDHFSLQDTPKFSLIGNFSLILYHMATLVKIRPMRSHVKAIFRTKPTRKKEIFTDLALSAKLVNFLASHCAKTIIQNLSGVNVINLRKYVCRNSREKLAILTQITPYFAKNR
jgi:hypothetical protein